MDAGKVRDALERQFEGVEFTVSGTDLLVPAPKLVEVVRFLRDDESWRLDYLSCLLAVDYPDDGEIEVVYILYSVERRTGPLVIKVRVPREEGKCRVPSVTSVWRGAEFQEREAYDLYGVTFDGHPDPRRILLWDGFRGHPMRKDFIYEDQDAIEYPEEMVTPGSTKAEVNLHPEQHGLDDEKGSEQKE
jgi:NADH/F420H2 dehydrogenase subunit C